MRRSAAPSKRNNFIPPPIATLAGNSTTNSKSINEIQKSNDEINQSFENAARNTSSLLNLLTNTTNVETSDIQNTPNDNVIENQNVNEIVNNVENTRIYNVVYGKKSGKKHKTWSGDGTLEICNNSAILKDLDGKIFGRIGNLKNVVIEDGTILSVGNNEVQIIELCTKSFGNETKPIQNTSKRKNFTSFKSESIELQHQHQPKKTDQVLSRCIKKRKTFEISKSENMPMVDALVMPCPSVEHQVLVEPLDDLFDL